MFSFNYPVIPLYTVFKIQSAMWLDRRRKTLSSTLKNGRKTKQHSAVVLIDHRDRSARKRN